MKYMVEVNYNDRIMAENIMMYRIYQYKQQPRNKYVLSSQEIRRKKGGGGGGEEYNLKNAIHNNKCI